MEKFMKEIPDMKIDVVQAATSLCAGQIGLNMQGEYMVQRVETGVTVEGETSGDPDYSDPIYEVTGGVMREETPTQKVEEKEKWTIQVERIIIAKTI